MVAVSGQLINCRLEEINHGRFVGAEMYRLAGQFTGLQQANARCGAGTADSETPR